MDDVKVRESGWQHYTLLTANPVSLWECQGCGVVVSDTGKHDHWHTKTRSAV